MPPDHSNIYYEGRFKWKNDTTSTSTTTNNKYILFDMPGFSISLTVQSSSFTSCSIYIKLAHVGKHKPHRFWIYLNETLISDRVIDTKAAPDSVVESYEILSSLPSNDFYIIKIRKITESDYNSAFTNTNYLEFFGFLIDSNVVTKPFDIKNLQSRRKIEFLGDSIMAGYKNLCKESNANELNNIGEYALESYGVAWPALVAANLSAEQHTVGII
jgi:hypothetical protein